MSGLSVEEKSMLYALNICIYHNRHMSQYFETRGQGYYAFSFLIYEAICYQQKYAITRIMADLEVASERLHIAATHAMTEATRRIVVACINNVEGAIARHYSVRNCSSQGAVSELERQIAESSASARRKEKVGRANGSVIFEMRHEAILRESIYAITQDVYELEKAVERLNKAFSYTAGVGTVNYNDIMAHITRIQEKIRLHYVPTVPQQSVSNTVTARMWSKQERCNPTGPQRPEETVGLRAPVPKPSYMASCGL